MGTSGRPRGSLSVLNPELAAAEAAVEACFGIRDFAGAIAVVAAYTEENGDAKLNDAGMIAGLQEVFASSEPGDVKRAAAMMLVWGKSKPYPRWLPTHINAGVQITELWMRADAVRLAAARNGESG